MLSGLKSYVCGTLLRTDLGEVAEGDCLTSYEGASNFMKTFSSIHLDCKSVSVMMTDHQVIADDRTRWFLTDQRRRVGARHGVDAPLQQLRVDCARQASGAQVLE